MLILLLKADKVLTEFFKLKTSIQFQTVALFFSACGKECEESPDSKTDRDAGRNSRIF